MNKRCTICGNILHNTIFKGGYICEDCIKLVKSLPLDSPPVGERKTIQAHTVLVRQLF